MKPTEEALQQYQQLQDNAACFELNSTVVKITGADRHLFLHNFCTNEIKGLAAGRACEAFILNGKGKTIVHCHVLNVGDYLLLHTPAPVAALLIEHLDRYIIREDVQLEDVTDSTSAYFIAGPSSAAVLSTISCVALEPNVVALDEPSGLVTAHVEIAGFGHLILSPKPLQFEIPLASAETLAMLRVEQKTPWFGCDIDDSNLPQELLRDDVAISFTKGCYLGQETVARIDAIGKVNRVIAFLQLSAFAPVGTELVAKDKVQGKLTSVAWSPAEGAFCALAIVRRPYEVAGTELQCGDATATVLK